MFSLFCLFCFSLLIPIKDWGKDHFTLVIVLQLSASNCVWEREGGGGRRHRAGCAGALFTLTVTSSYYRDYKKC